VTQPAANRAPRARTVGGGVNEARGCVSADLTKEPTLYVVGYAHLDTQWRWDYPK